tara:strand:+ start:2227 stop:3084 length:858 start_codon:yes stop_codon:yes gene_type:complete
MARRIFNVPIAVVSLVDEDRQWFKSCMGSPLKETARDISFCGHAILDDEIFIIPDTSKDERFADNPLVLNDPHIRFYAGYPLRFTDGSRLGTLCIFDTKPRSLNNDDIETLKDLGSTVENELAAIELATLDDLTKIPNRRGFLIISQHSLNLCMRQKMPATLVFMDLNKFKQINDKFGHAEGDEVLKSFANLISSECRESDLFARLGGDEFVILFINTSTSAATDTITRLQQSLNQYKQHANDKYDISFSFGMVSFNPDKHKTITALLEDSDSQMYKHKQQSSIS